MLKIISIIIFSFFLNKMAQAEIESRLKREAYIQLIRKITIGGDLKALSIEAEKIAKNNPLMEDGRELAEMFYAAGISPGAVNLVDRENWKLFSPKLEAFQRSHANFPSTSLIVSEILQAHAWAIRGKGFASEVNASDMEEFHIYMKLARDLIESRKAQLSNNPTWYSQRISIAQCLGEGGEKINSLFSAGVKRFPLNYAIYSNTLISLSPKWGGSIKSMEDFIANSENLNNGIDGNPMYIRMYWYLADIGYASVQRSKSLKWELIKSSGNALIKKYPIDWYSQPFFLAACKNGDKQQAESLLPIIKEPPSPILMEGKQGLYEQCLKWAKNNEKINNDAFWLNDNGEMIFIK